MMACKYPRVSVNKRHSLNQSRYTVKSFGHKLHGGGLWTWRIVLIQVAGETEIGKLMHIPLPSQLDDWNLYLEMMEADRLARQEELERAEKSLNQREGPEWDREMARLRASIEEAFRTD